MSPTGRMTEGRELRPSRRWSSLFWLPILLAFTAILAAAQAWESRGRMNPDGLSYLEMGTALLEGRPMELVNGHWSPLYAVLLGLGSKALDPPRLQAFAAVPLVNWLIFLFAAGSYWRLVRGMVRRREDGVAPRIPRGDGPFVAMAVLVFAFVAVGMVRADLANPDLLFLGLGILLAHLLLGLGDAGPSPRRALAFGLALGLAFLARSTMFVLLPAWLLAAWIVLRGRPRRRPLALCFTGFLLVAGPWILLLSLKVGHASFSESAKLNYAWHVNACTPREHVYTHWQGEDPKYGRAEHPTRRIWSNPDTFEFGGPVAGTYPPWFDPSYWHAGYRPALDLAEHARRLGTSATSDYPALLREHFGRGFALALVAILFTGLLSSPRSWLRRLGTVAPLLVVSGAGLALYGVVLVNSFYVAPFFLLGLLALAYVPGPGTTGRARAALWLLVAVMVGAWAARAKPLAGVATLARGLVANEPHPASLDERIASSLVRDHGWTPGTRSGFIGWGNGTWNRDGYNQYWAHLAGARIVSEVPRSEAGAFWAAKRETRVAILNRVTGAGADCVVSGPPPEGADLEGWAAIGDTGYLLWTPGRE